MKLSNRQLGRMVTEYEKELGDVMQRRHEFYAGLGSLEEAIRHATVGIQPNGKMNSHQRRLGYQLLERQAKVLVRIKDKLQAASTFDELHNLIAAKSLKRFGVLARYDTAERLGAYLGIYPDRVYLHAGTKKGYRNLGLPNCGGIAEVEDFPKPIRRLSPADIENFLCHYQKRFLNPDAEVRKCESRPKKKKKSKC